MNPIKKLKQELKDIALTIKTLKQGRKPKNYDEKIHSSLWRLDYIRSDYRHKHIAYCELRGTPRHLIETPREDNKPNENKITKIKEGWKELIDEFEALRLNA